MTGEAPGTSPRSTTWPTAATWTRARPTEEEKKSEATETDRDLLPERDGLGKKTETDSGEVAPPVQAQLGEEEEKVRI